MRRVNRKNIVKPVELDSNDCQDHLTTIIASPTQTKVSPDFYKGKKENPNGTIEFTVRDSLKSIYKNKCAYCEKLSHAPKIDHHRPKGKVVGAGNLNNGYYWLCYEWTNLLPSCTDCNSIEAKSSKYPLTGNRNNTHPIHGNPPVTNSAFFVYDSAFNTGEQPLLLHPEYSIPENNFTFDKQGKIFGSTPEGLSTVEILKLDNSDLNGWRRKIYDDYLSDLQSIVRKFFRQNAPVSENQFEEFISDWLEKIVNEANNELLEYTLFRKFILKNIDLFFISELDPVFQSETKAKITAALLALAV
jgi:hypothetical protein